ncbi:MAG: hypothetical protein A2836_02825 [Candidatus Taylorbacteria bacterium RIFCSPHIGHO2_01_FULL_45_63]|uniref:Glucose-6-phosphate 1-dehydrogenase n=1 Tax=Candidatus Taylorbacteria bacterium RIFCSPHIGHO2_02_FULL_45_35 TaxID=1802311 RepID=A0A1G2MUK7_9BACT|nr:MAG: hypothetical protein A2836_02825 [Candidatus Taylorbacteria bacterium RIFCSPHIGHO2_01_FULL_45_63]OHA26631.1 MAG: hypothetical protein A3D56_02240 [Candidatus Taylorbacteria bacterium RIFCSPHIGHO2_02_FULL_45_35]OHA33562.1 MAG: hypothetical protein A3A22_03545 [Candidatus Taylorbacteria bacterium RIFCSPLOWO2_01_FULL_45_34b]
MEKPQISNGNTAEAPTIFVIFGATGDLAEKKLFPALFDLHRKKLLPKKCHIVASARRPFSDDEFRKLVASFLSTGKSFSEEELTSFFKIISYHQGFFDEPDTYGRLAVQLQKIDDSFGQCSNKLFYLAVPPSFYETILKHLAASELTKPCGGELGWTPLEKSRHRRLPTPVDVGSLTGWTRILVEKPFGNDMETARVLDRLLGSLFKEEQIFRIDHYLAKESLENFLKLRFSNGAFGAVWNHEHISRVEVQFFQKGDVKGRGNFYDPIGALRDVGQNHLLEMAALAAMDEPKGKGAAAMRKARGEVLKKFIFASRDLTEVSSRAQYEGYSDEEGVAKNSQTETYFRLVLALPTPRWQGVPFVLEAGKALPESRVEIVVHFKHKVHGVCPPGAECLSLNRIVFRVESLPTNSKEGSQPLDAYEKVLLHAVGGDQTLFTSTEEVMEEWRIVMPVLNLWHKMDSPASLYKYQKGTMPKIA